MELKKAQRKTVKLRMGLSGASGFGKTYSALLLAHGMTNDWTKIAVIDTENGSVELYSNLGEFNVITLCTPFSPERYIEAIKTCENAGMEVIIIDSITHEWDGVGGCLDILTALGGKYQDWSKVTPRHQKFVDSILQSKCHIITTVRRKQDYEMTTENGKTKVQKVGTKEQTREGFEYELTLNLEFLNDNHLVKASKDRTGLFMNKPEFVITGETGKEIMNWCNTGKDQLQEAIDEMEQCKNIESLKECWSKWKQYQTTPSFVDEKEKTKIKLSPVIDENLLIPAMAELESGKTTTLLTATWNKYPSLQSNELFSKEFNRRLTKLKQPA
jgi:hypothetical protein